MTVINGYEQSDREQKLTILNLPSLEAAAKRSSRAEALVILVVGQKTNGL